MVNPILKLPYKALKFILSRKRFPTFPEIFSYFKIKTLYPPLPFFAQIEPTTKCNFNCLTCTRNFFSSSRLNRDLTLNEFKLILGKIPSIKVIKLQGMGEPFLNSYLEEILTYGKQKGIDFFTIVNGSLLKEKLHLLKYFKGIGISVDSSNKENFGRLRKGSDFEKIIYGIKEAVRYKKENRLQTEIGFNVVVSHWNYKEIPEIVNLAKSLRINSVGFVEVENWTTPKEKEFNETREFIKEARKYSKEIKKVILNEKRRNKVLKITFSSAVKRKLKCMWGFDSVFITVDGFITPCCIRMNPDVFAFGNIFKEDFGAIWEGEKYSKFRESKIKNSPNFICEFCPD